MLCFILTKPDGVWAIDTSCKNIPILMYHHVRPNTEAIVKKQNNLNVSPENFERQIVSLKKKGYSFLNLDQVYDALVKKQSVSPKSVAITFDDGYADNYIYAWPILKKYQANASLMLVSGLVGAPDYLGWDQIKQMKNSGSWMIYDHTWSHPPLASQKEDKIKWEIETSQKQIDENLGSGNKIIAYPYGSYNKKVLDIVAGLGYKMGLTTKSGKTVCINQILTLSRKRVGNLATITL